MNGRSLQLKLKVFEIMLVTPPTRLHSYPYVTKYDLVMLIWHFHIGEGGGGLPSYSFKNTKEEYLKFRLNNWSINLKNNERDCMRNFNYNLQVKDLQRYLKTFSMVKFELDFNFFVYFWVFLQKWLVYFLEKFRK